MAGLIDNDLLVVNLPRTMKAKVWIMIQYDDAPNDGLATGQSIGVTIATCIVIVSVDLDR